MEDSDIQKIKSTIDVLEGFIGNSNNRDPKNQKIPISIFSNKSAPLQSLIRYLKEYKKIKNCDISKAINRSPKTVYSSFIQSKNYTFVVSQNDSIKIPLKELTWPNCTISENLIYFLKSTENLKTVEIAKILNRSPSCISQIYKRSKNKKEKNE
jgi:hypothetical protein